MATDVILCRPVVPGGAMVPLVFGRSVNPISTECGQIMPTITKSRLSDKIHSEVLLQKAGLKCLNEAVASMTAVSVWKSKTVMDPLSQRIFQEKPRFQCTRSGTSKEICLPVPGYPTLSTNIMARIWNAVPGLQDASTLGAVKSLAKKWAKDIPR